MDCDGECQAISYNTFCNLLELKVDRSTFFDGELVSSSQQSDKQGSNFAIIRNLSTFIELPLLIFQDLVSS